MDTHVSDLLQLGRRGAERRLAELVDELRVLVTAFPHLSDAFDADGLPLSFIIRRDARGAGAKTSRRHRPAQTAAATRVTRRIKNGGTMRRRGD